MTIYERIKEECERIKEELVDLEYIKGLVDSKMQEIQEAEEPKRDFGWALDELKEGHRVSREAWKKLNKGTPPSLYISRGATGEPIIYARRASVSAMWFITQDDLLAEDWYEVQ